MSTYITYDWAEPEPEVVAHQLITLAAELEDMIEPMTIAGEITRMDIQENFDTQTDPSGAPWAPHAESYEAYALAHGSGSILNLYGDLESAATSPSAFIVTNNNLFFDASGLPEYWAWNNFGAERNAPGSSEGNIEFRKANKGQLEGFGALGGENQLPERPFVGLSKEAQAKIEATFFAWFNGEIVLGMSSRGTPFGRFAKRGPSGRFAKR